MTVHLFAYERGRDQAALDFVITLGGFTYLGWIAAYIIDLRYAAEWCLVGDVRFSHRLAYRLGRLYDRRTLWPA